MWLLKGVKKIDTPDRIYVKIQNNLTKSTYKSIGYESNKSSVTWRLSILDLSSSSLSPFQGLSVLFQVIQIWFELIIFSVVSKMWPYNCVLAFGRREIIVSRKRIKKVKRLLNHWNLLLKPNLVHIMFPSNEMRLVSVWFSSVWFICLMAYQS